MNNLDISNLSRRNFITVAGSTAAAVAFAPRFLFADGKGIVPTMIDEAAKATITTYPRRRNIGVFGGSGGYALPSNRGLLESLNRSPLCRSQVRTIRYNDRIRHTEIKAVG